MNTLQLIRFCYHPTGTLGRLTLPDHSVIYTVERPWLNNKPYISCIPEGRYYCVPYSSERFKGVYQLLDVPERSAILVHTANRPHELQGCIAPGLTLYEEKIGVGKSKLALSALKEQLNYGEFSLEIDHFVPEYP